MGEHFWVFREFVHLLYIFYIRGKTCFFTSSSRAYGTIFFQYPCNVQRPRQSNSLAYAAREFFKIEILAKN